MEENSICCNEGIYSRTNSLNILHSNLYIGVGNADFVSYADDNSIYDTDDFTSSFFRDNNVQNVFL